VDRRINWLLLANAMLGSFLSGTASRIFNISLPTIAQSLGTDLVGISWAYLAYQLTNVGLSLVFGRVGDLYGKEKVFAIGFAVFAVSSFFCGLSQNVGQLIFSRMLQGVGGAMTQSVSRALASEAVPEELGGRAQGYMTTAFHTGFLLGPSFGGLIIDYIHWRWTFFVLVPIAAAGSALSLANVKRREEPEQKSPVDYTGAMLLIALSTLLVLVLDRRFVEVLGADARGLMGLAFVGCLAILFYHERRTPSPIVNFALFKIRMFSLSNLCLCVMAILSPGDPSSVSFVHRISVHRAGFSDDSPLPFERVSRGQSRSAAAGHRRCDLHHLFSLHRHALRDPLLVAPPDAHARAERRRQRAVQHGEFRRHHQFGPARRPRIRFRRSAPYVRHRQRLRHRPGKPPDDCRVARGGANRPRRDQRSGRLRRGPERDLSNSCRDQRRGAFDLGGEGRADSPELQRRLVRPGPEIAASLASAPY
jgi:MFS family permease